MDIYHQIEAYLFDNPSISEWPEIRSLVSKITHRKPRQWALPGLACEAVGGTREQAVAGMAAIACFHVSIMLVDDMLDNDPRGEFQRLGHPGTANLAAAFQALGLETIFRSKLGPLIKLTIVESLNAGILQTAIGQNLDALKRYDEETYWRVTRLKSSPFFGAALRTGALIGGASAGLAEKMDHLGRIYGESIQIHDDLNDALEVPANPDWLQGQPSLPLLYAQIVNHPDRERFLELRQHITEADNLAEAQSILVHCGAISYCFDRIVHQYHAAQAILKDLPIQNGTVLEGLFRELILPIQEFANKMDPAHPISLSSF
jgi:geranylgeranyl diphosphate synthase type I